VTLKYRDQIGRNTSTIISQLISLVFSVCRDHNIVDLRQREHREILAEIRVWQIRRATYLYSFAFKSAFRHVTFKVVM